MKILAVDDDEYALELLVGTLKAAGFSDITVASSGAEALTKMASSLTLFDCFFLDIDMPEMDGIELCRQVRQFKDYKSAPILMITARSERNFIDGAFSAGATDYVNKPFDPLELSVRVKLAAKLVHEKRVSTRTTMAVATMKAKLDDITRFPINSAITIKNIPGMIDNLAMENYLLQLSRGQSFRSNAVAFAIKEIETIFAHSTPAEMYYTLADVTEAIATNMKTTDYMMAYCGFGKFACVAKRISQEVATDWELAIQSTIDEMEIVYDNGKPCNVTLLAGKVSKPSGWLSGNSLKLIDSALASVSAKRLKELEKPQRGFPNLSRVNLLKTG